MKNLPLFVSAFALCASTSFAAINCGALPTCESLGYNDIVAQCPNKSIKCPFDDTKGICLHEAAVGEVAYFAAPRNNKGWLPCDGQVYSRSKYPELASFLDAHPMKNNSSQYGNPYCNNQYHGGNCSTSTFAVPDYRGYFLKVAGMYRGLDKTVVNKNYVGGTETVKGLADMSLVPQSEQLPNLKGWMGVVNQGYNDHAGVFVLGDTWSTRIKGSADADSWGRWFSFDASKTTGTGQGVYKEGGHVIPVNYGIYAYIYAGKVVN